MITYQEEAVDRDFIEEIKPIVEKHSAEIDRYLDKIELSPAYDKYIELYQNGLLHCYTVRDDGILIGYYVSIILPHMHYSKDLYAINEILYVDPDYRKSEVAGEMFSRVESIYRDKGVSVMLFNMKTDHKFSGLADSLGFDEAEVVYSKCLKGE